MQFCSKISNNIIESPPAAELELVKIKSIATIMVAIVKRAKRDLKFNPVMIITIIVIVNSPKFYETAVCRNSKSAES